MDMWEKLHPKSHGQMGGDVQRGLDTLGGIFNQLSRAQQQQLLNMGFSFGGSIPGLGSAGVSHNGFSVNTNYGGFGGSWGQLQNLRARPEPVMCTMQFVDCSAHGGYDPRDPCRHTCMWNRMLI